MKHQLPRAISRLGCVALLAALSAAAPEHKWAGRTLNDLEWRIHEELALLPFHGVFDTLDFVVDGKTVTLSGQVADERVRQRAEQVTGHLDGVERVVNKIEVLPSSPADRRLRVKLYRAIYRAEPLEKYGMRAFPSILIIVKDGWATLEGVVDSDADRAVARQRAMKVTARVTDNLRVAPEE